MNKQNETSVKNRLWTSGFVIWMLLSLFLSGFALDQDAKNGDTIQASFIPMKDLEKSIDKFFASTMEKRRIPGAVFIMVKDGQILLAKGYGYADIGRQRPIVPEKTIFRAGSISKLFTATAVMQLHEKGLLKLDENVNHYLKRFQLEENFPQPVTMADLLTHTAGLAEHIHGQHTLDQARWRPLGEYLARRMPPRIMPPGEIFSYNDHGFSLAGFVVEEITGTPFETYVEKNIFEPLGMERSSFRQRLPSALESDLAIGYKYKKGKHLPYQLDYCQTVPAACLYTTAYDIARFMIAHLQDGRYGQMHILKETTAQEMHRRHFSHHPKLRGRAYGFSELFVNGQRVIFHDGGMPGFISRLCLLPEKDMGFFVSYNSDNLGLKSELTASIFDYLYPFEEKPSPFLTPSVSSSQVAAFEGDFSEVAGFSSSALKIGSVLQSLVTVKRTSKNTLAMFGSEYAEVEPLLFQDKDGNRVAFKLDENNRVRYLFVGSGAFERLAWFETPRTLLVFVGLFVLTFLPLGIVWPVGRVLWPAKFRLSWKRIFPSGRSLASLVSFLILFFLIGFVVLFLQLDNYWSIMRNEFPWSWMTKLLAVPIITSLLTLALLFFSVRAWIKKQGTTRGRLFFSFVSVAALLFIWVLQQWNLLGFKY